MTADITDNAPIEFEITPPSGLVTVNWPELWRYRELFLVMAWRDIAIRYKQTVLGVAWAIIQPLVNLVLFTVVFHNLGGIKSDDPNTPYAVMVSVGLVFWQFFSSTLSTASNSMVTNANIIQKVYFPRLIIPATAATTALVDTALGSTVCAGIFIFYRFTPGLLGLALLPVLLIIAALASLGGGLFLAAINIKYRDVRYALPFFIQILMYVTPVIYPAGMLHKYPVLRILMLWLNPMSGVITVARATLLHNAPFDPMLLLISAITSVLMFVFGLYYFRSTERYFADIA